MKQVNFDLKAILSKLPLIAVAAPASFGVAMFSESVYTYPVNVLLGLAFESVYVGAIFLAEKKSQNIFIWTVVIACLASATYNTLYAAQVAGILLKSGDILQWLIACVHGLPLPVLSVFFAWLLHFGSDATSVQPVQPDVQLAERLEKSEQHNLLLEYKLAQAEKKLEEAERTIQASIERIEELENTDLKLLNPGGKMDKALAIHLYSTEPGWSVRTLAAKAGVGASTVQNWLAGVPKYSPLE